MIHSIGKHTHHTPVGAAQASSNGEDSPENSAVVTPPTPLEIQEAKENKKNDDKKNADMMHVLNSAESIQMYNSIIGKAGMELQSSDHLAAAKGYTAKS